MDELSFTTLITDRIAAEHTTTKKVAELAGIPHAHLEALLAGAVTQLPPAPYVRGYVNRLGEVLSFDADAAWKQLRREHRMYASGARDALPRNRFAVSGTRRLVLVVALVLLVGFYAAYRLTAILGLPTLSVSEPAASVSSVTAPTVVLRGTVSDNATLKINGELVARDIDGAWAKEATLSQGVNVFTIEAHKFLGRNLVVTRTVVLEGTSATIPTSTTPIVTTTDTLGTVITSSTNELPPTSTTTTP